MKMLKYIQPKMSWFSYITNYTKGGLGKPNNAK